MAPRQIKLRGQDEAPMETVPDALSQRKRPEVGRFWLQVDRQTKSSYATGEAAEAAGMIIKRGHPVLHVSVYDNTESVTKIIEVPAGAPPAA